MLPSTICGQNPCEVRFLVSRDTLVMALFFSPAAFVQVDSLCYGEYEVEVILRDSFQVRVHRKAHLQLSSTSEEKPLTPNYLVWGSRPLPRGMKWELWVWDAQRLQGFYQQGHLPPHEEGWSLLVSEEGQGGHLRILTASQRLFLAIEPGTYLGQIALYQAESSLPELTRYLSIEEKRFTLQASAPLAGHTFSWRIMDLPPGFYLIGVFLYQGEELRYQAYYPVRRR